MSKLIIGKATCKYCGYVTTTGGIIEHSKHCPKNPDAIAKKRRKAVPIEVDFDSLPEHLQRILRNK